MNCQVTVAFASFSKNSVLCDADVDAADLHLLMDPQTHQRTDFNSGRLDHFFEWPDV